MLDIRAGMSTLLWFAGHHGIAGNAEAEAYANLAGKFPTVLPGQSPLHVCGMGNLQVSGVSDVRNLAVGVYRGKRRRKGREVRNSEAWAFVGGDW